MPQSLAHSDPPGPMPVLRSSFWRLINTNSGLKRGFNSLPKQDDTQMALPIEYPKSIHICIYLTTLEHHRKCSASIIWPNGPMNSGKWRRHPLPFPKGIGACPGSRATFTRFVGNLDYKIAKQEFTRMNSFHQKCYSHRWCRKESMAIRLFLSTLHQGQQHSLGTAGLTAPCRSTARLRSAWPMVGPPEMAAGFLPLSS